MNIGDAMVHALVVHVDRIHNEIGRTHYDTGRTHIDMGRTHY